MDPTPRDDDRLLTQGAAADVRRPIRGVTWRYLGDRTVADATYCVRFGVQQAPEPLVALDGSWAYELPGAPSLR